MKIKEFYNNLAKVNNLNDKINNLIKERDEILLKTTGMFIKGKEVTFMDKNNVQHKGKVLYCVGQKSLTVFTDDKQKVNVALSQLIFA